MIAASEWFWESYRERRNGGSGVERAVELEPLDHTSAYPLGERGGTVVGVTDDYGSRVLDKTFMIHDIHATMFHLLGIKYTRLSCHLSGRDMWLADVHGTVIRQIVA